MFNTNLRIAGTVVTTTLALSSIGAPANAADVFVTIFVGAALILGCAISPLIGWHNRQ